MRCVAVKSVDQQAVLRRHKLRDRRVRQRTLLINALRGHLAAFGSVAAQGPAGVKRAIARFRTDQASRPARSAIRRRIGRIEEVAEQLRSAATEIVAWCRRAAASRRLLTIPGIGPITASAIAAAGPDPTLVRSGRQVAAWLGLTPRPPRRGGKDRLGGIRKQGDGTIRRRLVVGATAVIRVARQDNPGRAWAKRLVERTPARLVSVALATKTARSAGAVMTRGDVYRAPAV
jgi:transposase